MSDIPKWQSDLADVIILGADVSAYMRFRRFLAEIETREDMATTQIFNALDLLARTARTLENKG